MHHHLPHKNILHITFAVLWPILNSKGSSSRIRCFSVRFSNQTRSEANQTCQRTTYHDTPYNSGLLPTLELFQSRDILASI